MDNLSKFSETLESLMLERELNLAQLAAEVGIGKANLSRYLNARMTPAVKNLVKLADYFQCTTDFLLGREVENYSTVFLPCPPFSEQLKVLKAHFKCPWWNFYRTTSVSSSRFYEWKNGTHTPSLDCIIMLADGFDCTVDFILGRTKN